jgi:hypothetical protein
MGRVLGKYRKPTFLVYLDPSRLSFSSLTDMRSKRVSNARVDMSAESREAAERGGRMRGSLCK